MDRQTGPWEASAAHSIGAELTVGSPDTPCPPAVHSHLRPLQSAAPTPIRGESTLPSTFPPCPSPEFSHKETSSALSGPGSFSQATLSSCPSTQLGVLGSSSLLGCQKLWFVGLFNHSVPSTTLMLQVFN